MQIENISAIPSEIDTVEKLYLWCYYQLSTTNERVEIEGEKEYLVDSELIRPDGVDPRLFLITKINLPIDENWLINGFKLWENAEEILNGLIEDPTPPIPADPMKDLVLLWLKGDDFTDSSPTPKTITLSGTVPPTIVTNVKKYGTGSIYFSQNEYSGYIEALLPLLGDTPFTIEMWVYTLQYFAYRGLYSLGSNTSPLLRIESDKYYINNINTNISDARYQWRHLALVVENGVTKNVRFYVNGINVFSTIATINITTDIHRIGGYYFSYFRSVFSYVGYLDSIRVTNAIRYTNNFDPETDTYLAY